MSASAPTNIDFGSPERLAEGLFGRYVSFPEEPRRLSSGLLSPVYADMRRLTGRPFFWHRIIDALSGRVILLVPGKMLYESGGEIVLAGVELGGVCHASALAYRMNLPAVIVRKEAKDHGTRFLIEGMSAEEVRGRKVVLIEDVVTLGGSCLRAVEILEQAGAKVLGALSILSHSLPGVEERLRQEGRFFRSLVTSNDVARHGFRKWNKGDADGLSPEKLISFEAWREDPFGWSAKRETGPSPQSAGVS